MEVKVSVIIAVYNAEKYICDCVRNILNMRFSEIEVIAVNDCSTDRSLALLEEIHEEDERLVILQQPRNMGPGEARNAGIRTARGKYLTFLDSDDALPEGALEKLYRKAEEYAADVVHGTNLLVPVIDQAPVSLLELSEDDLYPISFEQGNPQISEGLLTRDTASRINSWLKHEIHWSVWNKLYRTDFLRQKGIRFARMKMAEDQIFCFSCLINADHYLILPGAYYIYRLDPQSLSRGNYNSRFACRVLEAMLLCHKAVKESAAGNSFISDHPEYADAVFRYVYNGLDSAFLKPCLRNTGVDTVLKDKDVRQLFRKAASDASAAAFMIESFRNAYADLPDEPDIFRIATSPQYWRMQKEKGENNA